MTAIEQRDALRISAMGPPMDQMRTKPVVIRSKLLGSGLGDAMMAPTPEMKTDKVNSSGSHAGPKG